MSDGKTYGAVAEFESAAAVYRAAERLVSEGYRKLDTHTPFPIHGIDTVLKQGASHVGWICAMMGLIGVAAAQLMMWWMNGYDYKIWVSGKLPYDWPPTIPITFELMVLLSAFGAVFGMLGINKLPRLHHPIFKHSTIDRVTDDRFFMSVEASDPMFDSNRTVQLLESVGGSHVELVEE